MLCAIFFVRGVHVFTRCCYRISMVDRTKNPFAERLGNKFLYPVIFFCEKIMFRSERGRGFHG
jgi:hypothetical protein